MPSEPTIAVSIYCTAVCMSCSSIVGHASVQTAGSSAASKPRRGCKDDSATAFPPSATGLDGLRKRVRIFDQKPDKGFCSHGQLVFVP